jgi:hypothetical protein
VLIHIDGSAAADAVSTSVTARRSRACIENLLLAHFEGHHLVSMLPEDAEALRSLAWAPREQRALDHIDEDYAQIAGIRADATWSLELGLGPAFTGGALDTSTGRHILRAPLHAFERARTTACAVLFGEGPHDAPFFVELALMMRAMRRWDNVDLACETRLGGGATFATEFTNVANRGQIVIAVADSDKRHPGGGYGATYRNLLAASAGRPAYQRARSLPTRTAEGLVPLSVYREAFTSPRDRGDPRLGALTRLEQLFRSIPAAARQYAHLKSGITLYQVENPKTTAEGDHWRDIAVKSGRDACVRAVRDQCTEPKQCTCYVVDALGDKALADVVAWLGATKSKRSLVSRFALREDTDIGALADEVLAFGLALPPLYT